MYNHSQPTPKHRMLLNYKYHPRIVNLISGVHFDEYLQDMGGQFGSVIAIHKGGEHFLHEIYDKLPERKTLFLGEYDVDAVQKRIWYNWIPEMDLVKRWKIKNFPTYVYINKKCTGVFEWCVNHTIDEDLKVMGCENFVDFCVPKHFYSHRHMDVIEWIKHQMHKDSLERRRYHFLDEKLEERDWTTNDNQLRNIYLAHAFPNFTETGYKPMKTPQPLQNFLLNFMAQEDTIKHLEQWDNSSTQLNFVNTTTNFYNLDEVAEKRDFMANKYLKPILEEWAGVELELTAFYGIREYRKGSLLKNHIDRIDTHVLSVTICIDREGPEWPLEVIDFNGRHVRYKHDAGTMVLYESSKVPHGRPYPFEGKYHRGAFVHFKPKDDSWKEHAKKAREYKDKNVY